MFSLYCLYGDDLGENDDSAERRNCGERACGDRLLLAFVQLHASQSPVRARANAVIV